MARENKGERQLRLERALSSLEAAYPEAGPRLYFKSPFELLIATILSAQCTDDQVNRATSRLFADYPSPEAMAGLTEEGLWDYIRGCGLYHAKGRNILATCKLLLLEHGGEVPTDREVLMRLPGVGRKTANVVLSNAFGQDAIAVDTHVFRVANRIGFAHARDVLKTEQELMQSIPQEKWSRAHHVLIFHGREICGARRPKCESCVAAGDCEYYIKEIHNTKGNQRN